MFLRASCSVSPWDQQPGRPGTETLYPSSLSFSAILYFIVVTSLHRDFLPASWSHYTPSMVEVGILLGSFGLFFTCFLLFVRFAPIIAIHEVKHTLAEQREEEGHHGLG